MPASSPLIGVIPRKMLRELGQVLRDRRKKLGISAIATAEAAGMSRVTLHRIERGEASVAIGAYLSVIFALGLRLELMEARIGKHPARSARELPLKIRLADYPQLRRLAWQLRGTQEISPREALDIYERNWRHLDLQAMDSLEQEFLDALLVAFGRDRPRV